MMLVNLLSWSICHLIWNGWSFRFLCHPSHTTSYSNNMQSLLALSQASTFQLLLRCCRISRLTFLLSSLSHSVCELWLWFCPAISLFRKLQEWFISCEFCEQLEIPPFYDFPSQPHLSRLHTCWATNICLFCLPSASHVKLSSVLKPCPTAIAGISFLQWVTTVRIILYYTLY